MSLDTTVASTAQLTEQDLVGYVVHATKEVFSTMVMMDVEDSLPLTEPLTHFHCSVTSMVGLAGTYTGVLSVHCPISLAVTITSNMLGMEVDGFCEDVSDAMGEIANMLGGYVKQVLSKGGLDINLSIPTVISGEEYTIMAASEQDAVVIPFAYGDERFLVSLKLEKEG